MEKSNSVKLIVRTIGAISILLGIILALSKTPFNEYFYPIMIGGSLLVSSLQSENTQICDGECKSKIN